MACNEFIPNGSIPFSERLDHNSSSKDELSQKSKKEGTWMFPLRNTVDDIGRKKNWKRKWEKWKNIDDLLSIFICKRND